MIRNKKELFRELGIEYTNGMRDFDASENPYADIKKRIDDITSEDPKVSEINWDRVFYTFELLGRTQPFGKIISNEERDIFINPYGSKQDLINSAYYLLCDALKYSFNEKDNGNAIPAKDECGVYDNYVCGKVTSGHIIAEVYLYYSGNILVDSSVELNVYLEDDRTY